MFTSSVSSSESSTTPLTNSTAYKMNTDDFMELLVTELQNQDPMDPVSTSEMASQFASLSQVSQLTETNDYLKTLSHSQAVDYLGKTISYAETNLDGTSSTKTSLVNGVVYKDGTPYLVTKEGTQIAMSSVTGVS
jgi:flagellar basal-body rod modification protein FlgD